MRLQPAGSSLPASALSLVCGYSQRHLTAFQFGCSPTHWAIYGGAPMAHCCSEPFHENTRCFSSQVAGDSTAHTVTTRSTRFMPDIPNRQIDSTKRDETGRAKFQTIAKKVPGFTPPANEMGSNSEIDAKYQPRLVALEIDEIERGINSGWSPPHLGVPGRGQP